jgi:hypothetical protein
MKRAVLVAALVLALAACGSGSGMRRLDFRGLGATPVVRVTGQDAIPAIERPRFDPPAAVRRLLRSDDLVVGALVNGRAHAYPIGLLSLHEVVNDGPLAVTWCPLCPVAEVTWGEWLRAHPDTLVLSIRRDEFATRLTHPYDYVDARGEELSSDPYLAYTQKVNVYYSHIVGGIAGSTLVLGVRIDGVAKAYPLCLLRRPVVDTVAGHRLRIVPDADALSAAVVEHGSAVPATTAYWFAWHAFYPRTLVYAPKRR